MVYSINICYRIDFALFHSSAGQGVLGLIALETTLISLLCCVVSTQVLEFHIVLLLSLAVSRANWGYCGGSPSAVQAWQPCPLWEPSPIHPILL